MQRIKLNFQMFPCMRNKYLTYDTEAGAEGLIIEKSMKTTRITGYLSFRTEKRQFLSHQNYINVHCESKCSPESYHMKIINI